MSIREFLDSCKDNCEVEGAAVFNWSLKGVGFGQLAFYTDENGKTHCMNECMSKERVKKILNNLVDTCVMDDD